MERKKKDIVCGLIILVSVVILARLYGDRVRGAISEKISGEYKLEELTQEQKREDFEAMYETIITSVPFLEDIKKLYQIDFAGKKNYYLQEIKNTKDNFEYLCTLSAIMEEIPSYHTDMCFPLYSYLKGLNCYNSEEILSAWGMSQKLDAWVEYIRENVIKYESFPFIYVRYVDGNYVVEQSVSAEEYQSLQGYVLKSVNGISAENYFVEHLFIHELKYDFDKQKPYRTSFVLNGNCGEELVCLFENEEGQKIERNLYYHRGVEYAAAYGYLYSDWFSGPGEQVDFRAYRDDKNELEYIRMDNFLNSKAGELKNYLENMVYDKVVIDLRENWGGDIRYSKRNLYPYLYSDDESFFFEWTVPVSAANKVVEKDFSQWFVEHRRKDGNHYQYYRRDKYKGEAVTQRDIYYLIGDETGSAADGYVAMIKQNDKGILVGENTGGEGLGHSYMCQSLPNSSLVYIYYPAYTVTEEHKCGSLYGTSPDVYLSQTVGDFQKQLEFEASQKDWSYEEQMKYDTVLRWVANQ